MSGTIAARQKQIRELSERYLTSFFREKEAHSVSRATGQNKPTGPSTLEELSEALRNPLPKPPTPTRCYSAIEACKSYKPLTLEMVGDLLAKKRAARDAIIADYIKRTGQQVDYCDQCDMGVTEEEHEEGWQTVVTTTECQACDGLGVVVI